MKLTAPQFAALKAAHNNNGAFYGNTPSHVGGAYRRMCRRLAGLGLLDEKPPHRITNAGLRALLAEIERRQQIAERP